MRTVDDTFQSLDYLDQRGHVGDLVEGWGLQLGQQGADLLLQSLGYLEQQSAVLTLRESFRS